MDDIRNISFTSCQDSKYIKPIRMLYEQNGKKKSWDLMKQHDSVIILIYNISREVLVFVKQFRPAVYNSLLQRNGHEKEIDLLKYPPPSQAITLELCGGLIDKEKSIVEIAKEEVLEECGYSVPLSVFERVTSYITGVSITSPTQTLYYAEVTDSMRVSKGGGNPDEDELIEVVELTLSDAYSLIFDETEFRPTSLIMTLLWFFHEKCPKSFKKP